MMKAVAAALVLIAGAAVVLWYGNTLNSWILGGLIGGLAALLLSIPISLTLFSYLSRRRDDQIRAEAVLAGAARYEEYEQIPIRRTRGAYSVEEYVENEEDEEFWSEDERYYQEPPRPAMRNLPMPSPQRQSPAQSPVSNRLPAPPRSPSAPLSAAGTRSLPATRGRDAGSRRPPTRQMNYPGLPGYESGAILRQQRSAALRAARMEKLNQDEDDVEVLTTYTPSRRLPTQRPERDLTNSYEQIPRPRPSQQPPQVQKRQRVIESRPSRHDVPRALPTRAESAARQNLSWEDPDTETMDDNYYPQTEPIRRSTGPVGRNPRPDRQVPRAENPSGDLRKPLVRRAPYTYDDDPIRQELSQQLQPPKVRRSSRLDPRREERE